MIRKSFVLFFVTVSHIVLAGDSLKVYPKYIVDVNFSTKELIRGNYKYEEPHEGELGEEYEIGIANSTSLNFQYDLLKKNKSSSRLYCGIGINYTKATLNHFLYDHYTYQGLATNSSIEYTQNKFNYALNIVSLSPQLTYNIIFKRIILSNRLGVYFTRYSTPDSYDYQEKMYNSGYYKDPIYVTPQNPDDWYYKKTLVSDVSKTDKLLVTNDFNLFYDIGLGFRIGRVVPTISVEFTSLFNKYSFTFVKFQGGFSYLF